MVKVSLISIDKIKENPDNPRVIKDAKFKKLVQSITDFPKMLELRPIVVNDDMVVLGGNMRLRACIAAGIKKIPIIKASDLTPEEQKQFIIKDNLSFGDWEWEELANNWDAEALKEWGMDIPDFGSTDGSGKDPFNDPGITAKNQYGVIVMCEDEAEQKKIFDHLQGSGYTCKIVVT